MPDKHVTDEEIHHASGKAPRMPTGTPKATCLSCRAEYTPAYAVQAHDCLIKLAERRSYIEWLDYFRELGLGVLREPEDMKFQKDATVSGRTALTFHLQSDLHIGPGYELQQDYYEGFTSG